MSTAELQDQLEAALSALRDGLGSTEIVGAYLYGSAVAGGLRPDSDVDILVVTDRRLAAEEKARVVDALLPISGRDSRPAAWRPLDVTVVAAAEVRPWRSAPRMELQYGEWLRDAFLAGRVDPEVAESPDLVVLLTLVRASARPLIGPAPDALLDAVPRADLHRAMRDSLPALLADLEADTRNVLLTLARMWATRETGQIRSKDDAAEWAVARLPQVQRPMLAMARDLYRGGGYGDWPDRPAVLRLAEFMAEEIRR